MTEHPIRRPPSTIADTDAVVVRSEEQLLVTKPWVPYRRYRIGKRVVTEVRTITVEVRHEELVYEELPTPDPTLAPSSDALSDGPFEIVLHHEQIEVVVTAAPVERYRFHIERVDTHLDVRADLAQEHVDVE